MFSSLLFHCLSRFYVHTVGPANRRLRRLLQHTSSLFLPSSPSVRTTAACDEMTSLRRFRCTDLFRFNHVNLDHLTETVSSRPHQQTHRWEAGVSRRGRRNSHLMSVVRGWWSLSSVQHDVLSTGKRVGSGSLCTALIQNQGTATDSHRTVPRTSVLHSFSIK